MKKIISLLLAGVMVLSMAGCGNKEADKGEDIPALEVLETVWGSYADDEKFAIIGGDMGNPVDGAPGKFDISDAANLDATLGFPEANVAVIDDAASMIHMMNANTFTAGAYHVTDAGEVAALTDSLKDNIMNKQWMCGFPETLIIFKVGDNTLVAVYGNGELVDIFKTKLQAAYGEAEIVVEESLM